ncbi:MAG: hypothetical protein ACLFN1_10370, partial [Bacteroidales bacterium]
ATLRGNIPENGVSLLVHRTAEWYYHSEAVPDKGSLSIDVPAGSLPEGIVAFSFLDKNKRTLLTALWIKGDPRSGMGSVTSTAVPGVNSTELHTEYNSPPDRGHYTVITRRREPAETGDYYLGALPGWGSTWDIPLNRTEREGWMIASSYKKNVAEAFFADNNNKPSCQDINFSDISEVRETFVEYLPETRAYTISGKLSTGNGKGAGSTILSLSELDNNFFKTTSTFPDGSFYFALDGLKGQENLLLSAVSNQPAEMQITIDPDFDPRTATVPPAKIYLTEEEMVYAGNLVRDSRLEYIYRDTSLNNVPDTADTRSADPGIFYGKPDRSLFIDDYIKLPDMRELLFELVPEIMVRKDGDDFSMMIIGKSPFPDNYKHLILIDGIPLLSYGKLLELPPSRFERIDIINSLYIHGKQVFAGVVNFISVNGDMAGLDLPEGSRLLSLKIPAYTARGEMVTDNQNLNGFPRFSPTLAFHPFPGSARGTLSLRVNAVYDDYITIINGVTGSGKWISSYSLFEIRGLFER